MTQKSHVIAIDQGTTSSRAIVFDDKARPVATAQQEFTQHFPKAGWVEHDPKDLLNTTIATVKGALDKAGFSADQIAGIGITNQRETTLIWDRDTGEAIHNAIVWQDRRTADICADLKGQGAEALFQDRTGLLLDPYFSGTKIKWLLDNVDGARAKADAGKLAFGTVDTWLIWHLTGGAVHATDVTNASRTSLFSLDSLDWDDDLLAQLDVPRSLLPDVKDNVADYGVTKADLFGASIPIFGVAGDQQAATIGQACFQKGMLKSTYGTGCFALVNTGPTRAHSRNQLLGTVGYKIGDDIAYALEGSIFMAGASVQWLRDGLKLFPDASETEALAKAANPDSPVYVVPAFTGLGAPYWDPEAKGAILGLTRDAGIPEIVSATLDGVCYQTRDLMDAMAADMAEAGLGAPDAIRVDGGMVVNDWVCQRLADLTGRPVERPEVIETTALGAAYLAGLGAGLFSDLSVVSDDWACDRRFEPEMAETERERRYTGWQEAVQRVLTRN